MEQDKKLLAWYAPHVPDNQESMRYIRRLQELYPGTIPDKQEKEPNLAAIAAVQPDKRRSGKSDTSQAAPMQAAPLNDATIQSETKEDKQEKPSPHPEKVYLTITPKKLFLQMPNEYADINFVRKLRYARWNYNTYLWEVTAHTHNLTMLQHYFGPRLIEQRPAAPEVDTSPTSSVQADHQQILVFAKEGRLRLVFRFNKALVAFIKTLPFYKYDEPNRWWTVPDTEVIRKDIQGFAQARGWKVSYASGNDKPDRKPRPSKEELPNYRACPEEYISQLKMKRYSPNTIRNYTDLFEEYINPAWNAITRCWTLKKSRRKRSSALSGTW